MIVETIFLCLSTVGCGGDDSNEEVDNQDVITEEDETADEGLYEQETLNVEDLYFSEEEDMGYHEEEYDFELKVSRSYAMDALLQNVPDGDYDNYTKVFENIVKEKTKEVYGADFEVVCGFDEYEGEVVDKELYVMATEDDDVNKCYMEAGAYHDTEEGKNYVYNIFTSYSYFEYSDKAVEEAVETLEKGFGISVSEKKVKKAVKEAMEIAENSPFCVLYEEVSQINENYEESIIFSTEGGYINEEEIGFYLAVEVTRTYN